MKVRAYLDFDFEGLSESEAITEAMTYLAEGRVGIREYEIEVVK